MKLVPIESRFYQKVRKEPSGCHEWTGHVMRNGYGQVSFHQKPEYSHRVAWELAFGPIPEGKYILHKCDNRKCVNPEHLFTGTFQDNMDDMVRKKRQASGNRSGRRKISSDLARKIRDSVGTQAAIAANFGVSQCTVSMIRSGRIWKDI